MQLPAGFAVRHQGLAVIMAAGRIEFRFSQDEARGLSLHLGSADEHGGRPLPQHFEVRREGGTVILAVSPTLEYQFTEPEARAIAWSLMSEAEVSRRTRHVSARGD